MKPVFFAVLLTALSPLVTHAQGSAATPVSLDTFRDRNRLVVVYTPAADGTKAEQFRKGWTTDSARTGARERDIVLIEFSELKAQPDAMKRLDLREGKFTLALIGKDGHVAFRTDEPVEPPAIFGRIDAMPMRREEVKARGQGESR